MPDNLSQQHHLILVKEYSVKEYSVDCNSTELSFVYERIQ